MRTIKLRGVVCRGLGQSRSFTEIPWVNSQFINKLGINPYPGTFNITIIPEDKKKLISVMKTGGTEIVPQQAGFCSAQSLPVLVQRKVKGATVIPAVADYPGLQLEIISAQNVRQALGLKEGDIVEIEVYLP